MSAIVLASTKDMPYEDWLEYRKLGIGLNESVNLKMGLEKKYRLYKPQDSQLLTPTFSLNRHCLHYPAGAVRAL